MIYSINSNENKQSLKSLIASSDAKFIYVSIFEKEYIANIILPAPVYITIYKGFLEISVKNFETQSYSVGDTFKLSSLNNISFYNPMNELLEFIIIKSINKC